MRENPRRVEQKTGDRGCLRKKGGKGKMEKEYSVEEMIAQRFEANKQRGKYLAFIVRELDRQGFKGFDKAIKKAIFEYGRDKSKKWGKLGAQEFMNYMMDDKVGKGVFQFKEIGTSTKDHAEFIFERCPLEEGWKEMGLSDGECHRLCSLAREHDFGLVANEDNQDLKLEMPESIGLGDPVCRLIITKKK